MTMLYLGLIAAALLFARRARKNAQAESQRRQRASQIWDDLFVRTGR